MLLFFCGVVTYILCLCLDAYTWDYEDSAEDLYETKSKSEAMQYYIMPSSSSMRVLSKKNRKNGIIEECCRRACDVSELLGYCAQ